MSLSHFRLTPVARDIRIGRHYLLFIDKTTLGYSNSPHQGSIVEVEVIRPTYSRKVVERRYGSGYEVTLGSPPRSERTYAVKLPFHYWRNGKYTNIVNVYADKLHKMPIAGD